MAHRPGFQGLRGMSTPLHHTGYVSTLAPMGKSVV